MFDVDERLAELTAIRVRIFCTFLAMILRPELIQRLVKLDASKN